MNKDYGAEPGPKLTPELQKRWSEYLKSVSELRILHWQREKWLLDDDEAEDWEGENGLIDWDKLPNRERFDWQMRKISDLFPVEITLKARFWLDNTLLWNSKGKNRQFTRKLDLDEYEAAFGRNLRAVQEKGPVEIKSRIATIRSEHDKAKNNLVAMADLGDDESRDLMREIEGDWETYLRPIDICIDLKVVTVKEPKSRPSDSPTALNPTTPAIRNTRTNDRLGRAPIEEEEREARGNFGQELGRRWMCDGDWCTNRGSLCWKHRGDHYNITTVQQKAWSAAVAQETADVEKPPLEMALHWINVQGMVQPNTKYPERKAKRDAEKAETKGAVFDISEGIKGLTQIAMQNTQLSMVGTLQTLGQSSVRKRRSSSHSTDHSHQHRIKQAVRSRPAAEAIKSKASTPETISSTTSKTTGNRANTGTKRAGDRSSPIDATADNDEIVEAFFLWLIERTKRDTSKARIQAAMTTALDEMWSLDDLVTMNDMNSPLYSLAVRGGIADGLARSLKGHIHNFKQVYRKEKETLAATALMTLQG